MIESRLGQGGMGEVYAARDTSLDRPVAIKVLRGDVTRQAGMIDRFLREARSQAKLSHPNIVSIHYIGRRPTPGGEVALLRHGAGERRRPRRDPPAGRDDASRGGAPGHDPDRARPARRPAGRGDPPRRQAVEPHARARRHHQGRRLPGWPSRSTATTRSRRRGALVGGPYYIAPEQAVGDDVDHRADMYALGASFHHLLVGKPPFDGPRPMAVVAKHLSEPLVPLAKSAPHVPPQLARIVERLLEKKPEDRYPDYDALIADLEQAAPGRRAYAPIPTRAVAVLGDFLLAGALIGALDWIGLVVYLALVTAGHGWRGQSPAKYLLGVEVRRDDGHRLGYPRALLRTLVSLWMPILTGAIIALTSGVPELLSTIESMRPADLASLQNMLIAMAISQGFPHAALPRGAGHRRLPPPQEDAARSRGGLGGDLSPHCRGAAARQAAAARAGGSSEARAARPEAEHQATASGLRGVEESG
ncbi:MAG: RDD family protein [Sandaracinaceae bacterium]|nr:RDD family protein [Sandaracinaceae bacterium]